MWLAPRWAAWLSPPNGLGTTKVLCSNGRQKAERVAVTFHWRTFFSVFRTMLLQLHNGKLNWIFSSLDFVSGFHTLSVNSVLPFAWVLLKIFYCLLYTRMQWITRKCSVGFHYFFGILSLLWLSEFLANKPCRVCIQLQETSNKNLTDQED